MMLPTAIFQKMDQRNKQGQAYEQAGEPERAIPLYEANVTEQFFGTFPYDRLRIIYTRQNRFKDAIRVCEAYLALPDREYGQNKPHFQHHRDRLQTRLEK
jgi:hypothetical protein